MTMNDRETDGKGEGAEPFDERLRGALHDLPLPAGIAERVNARLAAGEKPAVDVAKRANAGRFSRLSRRQVLVAGGSLAASALGGFAIYRLAKPQRVVSRDELAADLSSWPGRLEEGGWRDVTSEPLPKGVVLDSAVLGGPVAHQSFWHESAKGWSGKITAISLAPAGQPVAMVFVVAANASFRVPAAPTFESRVPLSDGLAASAWQPREGGALYVLVVDQQRGRRLEAYLRERAQA